jgi:Family of unknown function (DUF6994)
MRHVIQQMPSEEVEDFLALAYTIGGFMVWPCNPVDGKWTITHARGCTPRIADRMGLTLECVRRFYLGEPSPLEATLRRYADFFSLFGDFRGFVDHFLFQDLTTPDYSEVVFFLPFDDFKTPGLPGDLASYLEYRRRTIDFIAARNRRIDEAVNRGAGEALAG